MDATPYASLAAATVPATALDPYFYVADQPSPLLGVDAPASDETLALSPIRELSEPEKRVWYHQDIFLAAYPVAGNILAASIAVHMSDRQVRRWVEFDVLGFRSRLEYAEKQHREHLEELMFRALERAEPKDILNHPILAIFALKGAWPDRYRDAAIQTDDTAKEILAQISKMQRERRRGAAAAQPSSDEEAAAATG